MHGEGTGKHLLQNNLSILISYVDKPLRLFLACLLPFLSLFLPTADVTQTQFGIFFFFLLFRTVP